jgi:hypothetical protein
MGSTGLSALLAIQISLELLGEDNESAELTELVEEASLTVLTGAEIGVAKHGSSFDVRDAQAMALSRAYRDGFLGVTRRHERKAVNTGRSDDEIQTIKRLVAAHA